MPRSDQARLPDIVDAASRIGERLTGVSLDQFARDDTLQRAVLFDFAVVGEAAKGISPHLRSELASVPWSAMAKMRDFVVHQYWGIDARIV